MELTASTPIMIGKFRVIKLIRRGGMGELLLALDDDGMRVAIKRPFKTAGADEFARFAIEADALRTLSHPNIPAIYAVETQEDGLPFMAMEFVDGEPLDKVIESGRSSGSPLDIILKLSIIEQVCSALGYAHENGIIHRDIKPANIILQANDQAKLVDFGIAKVTNMDVTSGLTQAGDVIGTLHYLAPERLTGKIIDGRADVFSTGVMLFLMLTGTLPFVGGQETALHGIVSQAHGGLRGRLKDYPHALDGIIDKALAKDPIDRYTAEEFADALREVITEQKRAKVALLFDNAERLNMEGRFEPALDLLDEAVRLDSANTQVQKLRRLVRDHRDRRRKVERLRDCLAKADEHLSSENYVDAITALREAQRIDPESSDVKDRLALAEEKKQLADAIATALADAESSMNRGDITAALRIVERATEKAPENTKLLAARAAIAKQLEREAVRVKVESLLEAASRELGQQNFPAMEQLLTEAEALDSSNPQIEKMRADLARRRDQDERRRFLEGINLHVNDFLRSDKYDKAAELLDRAIEMRPDEPTLHRLKMDVDAAARKYDSKQVVDAAIASARQTFESDPEKALADLRTVLEQLPGEERLVAYELSLRQQAEDRRKQQHLGEALRAARESLASRQPEKAVSVLEAYQLEHGHQADADDLLNLARQELNTQQLRAFIDRTTADVRPLVEQNPIEAIHRLEVAVKDPRVIASGDKTLSRLLEDLREQQAAAARKIEAAEKRAQLLSARGELGEAIKVLEEFLATGSHSAAIENQLQTLRTEQERKQVTARAIQSSVESTGKAQFAAAFESLQAIVRVYGESDELTRATAQVKAARAANAQSAVNRAIEGSRAALLNNDVPGAMNALRVANDMVEFADPARQAEWRRMGQLAKKAESQPKNTGAKAADLLAELEEGSSSRRLPMPLLIGGGAVALVGIVFGAIAIFKPAPKSAPPPPPLESHLHITKAPAGASVSIDGGPSTLTDATGSAELKVEPGKPHALVVKMAGYQLYTENVTIPAGETFRDPVVLTKEVAIEKAGTLQMVGNIAGFKLAIDGKPRGEIMRKESPLTLEEGPHTVRYSNEDGSGAIEHQVTIVAGKTFTDKFTLTPPVNKPPTVSLGSLEVQTNPNARVSVDGVSRGTADGSGKLIVPSLPVGPHTVDISLEKYQSLPGKTANVSAGQTFRLTENLSPLPPPPPSMGTLSVSTNPQAQISIDGDRKGNADGTGQFDQDLPPGTHALVITLANHQSYTRSIPIKAGATNTVTATLAENAPPPPPPQPKSDPAPQPRNDTPTGPDPADLQGIKSALRNFEQAYNNRDMARVQATWLDIGARAKTLSQILGSKDYDYIHLQEDCKGQPDIAGNTATQNCSETVQYGKSGDRRTFPKKMTFSKSGGTWVMKDKTP